MIIGRLTVLLLRQVTRRAFILRKFAEYMISRALAAVAALAAAAAAGTFAFAVVAAPAGATTVQRIKDPTRFMDNFDNGRTSGWLPRTLGTEDGPADWHVSAGQLVQSSNVHGGSFSTPDKPGTMFAAGDPKWRNYDYTVRAKTADNDAFGVVFRYLGPRNFYRFSMNRQLHTTQLVKRVQGNYSVLARSSMSYLPETWYRLRIVAVGSRLQVFVNGDLIFDVTDTSLGRGRIGLYTWGCPTVFDDASARVQTSDFFTIAVLPDTQFEASSDPRLLAAQTSWLTAHRATLHLADVLHEGDVVNVIGAVKQWGYASKYMRYLDGKVPYSIAAGNHDLFNLALQAPYAVNPTQFNRFVRGLPDYRISGRYAAGSFLNTFQLLDAGGVHLLVMNLMFGARDDVLRWAGNVVDRYPGRHVVLLTHDYLGSNNLVRGPGVPGGAHQIPTDYNKTLNDPTEIWSKFVKVHPNVQFTLNGHVIDRTSPTEPWAVGRLVSTNAAGRHVYQTLANYQTYDKTGRGYLRLMRFSPSTGTVSVTTYSPAQGTYLRDSGNQFTYSGVDLGGWPPAAP